MSLVSLSNRTAFYPQTISVFNIVIFGLAALSRLYDDEPEKMVAGLAGIFVNVVLLCGVKVGKLSLHDKKIWGKAKPEEDEIAHARLLRPAVCFRGLLDDIH